MNLLAKDYVSHQLTATEALVDEQQMAVLACDVHGNMQLFFYDPASPDSFNGQKLLSRADIHFGATVHRLKRVVPLAIHGTDSTPPRRAAFFGIGRRFEYVSHTCSGTLEGALGFVTPVAETVFRRLWALQQKMVQSLPHVAGLNPKSFRYHVRFE